MFKSSWSKVLGGVVLGAVGVPFLKSDIAKTEPFFCIFLG